jgi:hypothetical protein
VHVGLHCFGYKASSTRPTRLSSSFHFSLCGHSILDPTLKHTDSPTSVLVQPVHRHAFSNQRSHFGIHRFRTATQFNSTHEAARWPQGYHSAHFTAAQNISKLRYTTPLRLSHAQISFPSSPVYFSSNCVKRPKSLDRDAFSTPVRIVTQPPSSTDRNKINDDSIFWQGCADSYLSKDRSAISFCVRHFKLSLS